MTTKEQVIAWARESKLIPAVICGPSSEHFRYIEEYTKLVRNAALEEAALIFEQQHTWISNVSATVLTRNLKDKP